MTCKPVLLKIKIKINTKKLWLIPRVWRSVILWLSLLHTDGVTWSSLRCGFLRPRTNNNNKKPIDSYSTASRGPRLRYSKHLFSPAKHHRSSGKYLCISTGGFIEYRPRYLGNLNTKEPNTYIPSAPYPMDILHIWEVQNIKTKDR